MKYTAQNVTDATTRLRILIEGVKLGYIQDFNSTSASNARLIRKELGALGVENLKELSQTDMRKFIRQLTVKINNKYLDKTHKLRKELNGFFDVDMALNMRLWTTIASKSNKILDVKEALKFLDRQIGNLNPLYGKKAFDNIEKLQKKLLNLPLSANGKTVEQMLDGIRAGGGSQIEQRLLQGWANGETIHETQTAVASLNSVGLSSTTQRIANQTAGAIDTMMSHIHNTISAQVESSVASEYVYMSVIDSRTSDICLELDGEVFKYGKGPIPPLHPYCRSQTQALLTENKPEKESYLKWLERQPEEIQIYMIGGKNAKRLQNGELKAGDLGKYKPMRAVKLENLENGLEMVFQGIIK